MMFQEVWNPYRIKNLKNKIKQSIGLFWEVPHSATTLHTSMENMGNVQHNP